MDSEDQSSAASPTDVSHDPGVRSLTLLTSLSSVPPSSGGGRTASLERPRMPLGNPFQNRNSECEITPFQELVYVSKMSDWHLASRYISPTFWKYKQPESNDARLEKNSIFFIRIR
ncbi:hypothetical protein CEXT_493421 [Caerostris extrusa]|uniref:Uncharacterized protein n=1 Tax=Caerostris extrusa TaxID=172846 RepID=A0AAV4XT71_CAEEX|nr:hypothetical protein CEXT_493421 [Caerostris extrusa]